MGTSKGYDSPKWPGVNDAVGVAVGSNSNHEQVVKAVRSFAEGVENYYTASGGAFSGGGPGGGSGSAARTRAAKTGARLAQFIHVANQSGLSSALKEFNLIFLEGKPLEELLDSLIDCFVAPGGLLDDDSLRRAMEKTLDELALKALTVEEFGELLQSKDFKIEYILQVFYANLLYENFEQKEYGFVRDKVSQDQCRHFFDKARSIIKAIVRDELSPERSLSSIDWNSFEGQRIADEINQDVLSILLP